MLVECSSSSLQHQSTTTTFTTNTTTPQVPCNPGSRSTCCVFSVFTVISVKLKQSSCALHCSTHQQQLNFTCFNLPNFTVMNLKLLLVAWEAWLLVASTQSTCQIEYLLSIETCKARLVCYMGAGRLEAGRVGLPCAACCRRVISVCYEAIL